MEIIGREKEIKELKRLFASDKPELVAVYGRRRVGKTYLINNLFADEMIFTHIGSAPDDLQNDERGKMRAQLESFYGSLLSQGLKKGKKPRSWIEAFTLLISLLESKRDGNRHVVFIDELPWLDTPRSSFLSSFSWFWNQWGSKQKDLMFIVCGSAISWINNHLINAHGGLYDRLTYSIRLSPFSLKESAQFLRSLGINTSNYKIAMLNMVLGGIPYYLSYYDDHMSLEENIDNLFFKKDAKMANEFDNLLSSSFENEKLTKKFILTLAKKREGYTRKELLKELNIADGAIVGDTLKALKHSDFIIEYVPYKESKNKKRYKVIDPFCLFYLKYVYEQTSLDHDFFSDSNKNNWVGVSFENLCFSHLDEIKRALGIRGINTMRFSWFMKEKEENGAQIDLLIERKDNIISLCEMKFLSAEFKVDKEYHLNLMNKIDVLRKRVEKEYRIVPTLITTYGLADSPYKDDFSSVITIDELFE